MDVTTLKDTINRFMKGEKLKYSPAYHEQVELKKDLIADVRMVRPEDKELFKEGFKKLSPYTRFLRFHDGRSDLSSTDLAYFTEVDGQNHVAIAASTRSPNGSVSGMGVARFIRFKGQPEVAEVAIVIQDEYQKMGLGTVLMKRLIEAAKERGIRRLHMGVLPENKGMRGLLDKVFPFYEQSFDGEQLIIDVAI